MCRLKKAVSQKSLWGEGGVTEQTQKSWWLWDGGHGILKIQIFIVICKISVILIYEIDYKYRCFFIYDK